MIRLLTLLMAAAPATASPFPVNDQDQANILFICEAAARSPNTPIEQVAVIAQYCVQWKQRQKDANDPPAADPRKPEPPK